MQELSAGAPRRMSEADAKRRGAAQPRLNLYMGLNATGWMMDRYRTPPGFRAYQVENVPGQVCPWHVMFTVDGERVGGGQYRTPDEADAAGVDFMFSGWGDD